MKKITLKSALSLARQFYLFNPAESNHGFSEEVRREYFIAHEIFMRTKGVSRVRTRPSKEFLKKFQEALNLHSFEKLHLYH